MYLCSLAQVKAWITLDNDLSDAQLTRLIKTASSAVLNYIQRPNLAKTAYSEVRNGRGTQAITLRNWPVQAVSSLSINGTSVPAAANVNSYGFMLEQFDATPAGKPQQLYVSGGNPAYQSPSPYGFLGFGGMPAAFPRGAQNIAVAYTAGYCVANEAQTVAAHTEGTDPVVTTYRVSPNAIPGPWSQDDGVTLANGTPLTAITSGNPAALQYRVVQDDDTLEVYYLFNIAQNNAGVLLSYSYIPWDLNNAAIELVGEQFSYKDRIGLASKSLGGQETMAYNLKAMPDFVKATLAPYRLRFPVG